VEPHGFRQQQELIMHLQAQLNAGSNVHRIMNGVDLLVFNMEQCVPGKRFAITEPLP